MSIKKIHKTNSTIHFSTKLYNLASWTIVRLPLSASKKLPSRGMTMVDGIVNNFSFQAALEPDGIGSHWLKLDQTLQYNAGVKVGDIVDFKIIPSSIWPEPEMPEDLKSALTVAPQIHKKWMDITTMARWDWIRWIRSTKQPETRKRRIEVALSKLISGAKRPCCFNRTICTEPYISNNGVLLNLKS